MVSDICVQLPGGVITRSVSLFVVQMHFTTNSCVYLRNVMSVLISQKLLCGDSVDVAVTVKTIQECKFINAFSVF